MQQDFWKPLRAFLQSTQVLPFLVLQELVLFWEEKARGKGKERDLFLFEKGIVNTKRKEGGRKFVFKNMLKVWIFVLFLNCENIRSNLFDTLLAF